MGLASLAIPVVDRYPSEVTSQILFLSSIRTFDTSKNSTKFSVDREGELLEELELELDELELDELELDELELDELELELEELDEPPVA